MPSTDISSQNSTTDVKLSTDEPSNSSQLSNKNDRPSGDPYDSKSKSPKLKSNISLPAAIIMTLAIVIIVREGAVLVCQTLGFANAANIVGMITLFVLLIICRFTFGIPDWITEAGNTLLVDSGFAFLPVSAGAGLLIFGLGYELWSIMIIIIISTLLPLWGLAKLSNAWLGNPSKGSLSSLSKTDLDTTSSASNTAPNTDTH